MKYEMIFGDEALFDGAGLFAGVDIVTRNVDDGLYRTSRLSDCTPSTIRKNPIVAMRRIIKEPKRWTWEDKKAGRLPEVGSLCRDKSFSFKVINVTEKYVVIDDVVSRSVYALPHHSFMSSCDPIETPAEKSKREEDELIRSLAGTDIHYGTGTVKELFDQGARAAYRKLKGGE